MEEATTGGQLTFFFPIKGLSYFIQSRIMALQRRVLLQIATGVGVGLAGCSSLEGTNTESPTDSTDATPETQDIHVVIHNHLSQAIPVTVNLSTEQTVLVDVETTIEPNGVTSLDTGITETGHFDLKIISDDRQKETSFEIEEYDLEMGSNIIFWVDEDEIRYGIEE